MIFEENSGEFQKRVWMAILILKGNKNNDVHNIT